CRIKIIRLQGLWQAECIAGHQVDDQGLFNLGLDKKASVHPADTGITCIEKAEAYAFGPLSCGKFTEVFIFLPETGHVYKADYTFSDFEQLLYTHFCTPGA